MMTTEQEITTTTFIKLDKWDALKVLFGRTIKVKVKSIIPQSNPIERFNSVSNVEIVSSTAHFRKKSHPDFGYEIKAD